MSHSSQTRAPHQQSGSPNGIEMVKYHLPTLLAELKIERATGTMAMEKLQQADIGNLFQNKQRRRRGKSE